MKTCRNLVDVASGDLSESALIEIDVSIYPRPAALKAAYWITDRCHVRLVTTPEGKLFAEICTKDGRSDATPIEIRKDFENALVDFTLRERIASETREIHEALIKRAFVESMPKVI